MEPIQPIQLMNLTSTSPKPGTLPCMSSVPADIDPATRRQRWAAVKAVFDSCEALPAPERERHISAAQLAPAEVAELRSLLAHHDAADDSGDFLATAAAQQAVAAAAGPAAPLPSAARVGQRLGAWEVVRAVGTGGMGEVFEARRADGSFEGRAAIKLLKRGMDSAAVLQRFALERQALARLSHNHIARLLDAGASEEGLPYFVLEFVAGQPIDQAVRGLALEPRLQLFLQLADAVAHAHRNLLVHRDLKPGNVLVNTDGQVKLLDFGIAKALDPVEAVLDNASSTTLGGQRPYTPHYASPEQVRGEPVTTATDVYSLGVLLYQLLTGLRPSGHSATTAAQIARSVLHDIPARPSSVARPAAQAVPGARLAGDLDNIVLKALRKEPGERYASVDALASDVRAHLQGQPVSVRADSAGYVLGRLLRRHRWLVVAASLGVIGLATGLAAALARGQAAVALGALGLAAGLGLALVQGRKAEQARALAEQQAERARARFEDLRLLAHNVLFDYHDLVEPLQGATPVRKRLVADALVYLDKLAQDAPSDRKLRVEMGMAYRSIGLVQRNGYKRPHLGDTLGAMRSFDQAMGVLQQLVDEDSSDENSAFELAVALSAKAGVLFEEDDKSAGTALLDRAAALFAQHMAHDTPDLRHRLELARTHFRAASAAVSFRDFEHVFTATHLGNSVLKSLAALQPAHPELPHVWVWHHFLMARYHQWRGDGAQMQQALERNRELMDGLLAEQPNNARFLEDRASVASFFLIAAEQQADLPAVRLWGAEAVQRWGRLAGNDGTDLNCQHRHLEALIDQGRALAAAGAPDEGLQALLAARATIEAAAKQSPNNWLMQDRKAQVLAQIAALHAQAGRHAQAQVAFEDAKRLAAALLAQAPNEPVALTSAAIVALRRAHSAGQDALQTHASAAGCAAALAELKNGLAALQSLRASRQLLPLSRVEFIERGQALAALLQTRVEAAMG
jgi:eukaryotic-like serine/threonine-protein kinase